MDSCPYVHGDPAQATATSDLRRMPQTVFTPPRRQLGLSVQGQNLQRLQASSQYPRTTLTNEAETCPCRRGRGFGVDATTKLTSLHVLSCKKPTPHRDPQKETHESSVTCTGRCHRQPQLHVPWGSTDPARSQGTTQNLPRSPPSAGAGFQGLREPNPPDSPQHCSSFLPDF